MLDVKQNISANNFKLLKVPKILLSKQKCQICQKRNAKE